MQHRRNLSASIHKLPTDVMVMIFAAYTESSSLVDTPNLLDLTTVNKLWYDTIINSPQLWTVLESDFPPKIARLVIGRSKNFPLTLIWDTASCAESESRELKEVLKVVAPNSTRLKSIKMKVTEFWGPNRYIQQILESNMPHLERLEVKTVRDYDVQGERLGGFTLWDGPPLREIALDTISLSSWDSPRLTGLVALDFTKPHQPPAIRTLWNILSNSPQLERLRLCELGDSYDPWNYPNIESITLPCLKEMFLGDLAGAYLSAMLMSVYAPPNANVHISGNVFGESSTVVLEEVFTPGNIHSAALLGLGDSGSRSSNIPVTMTIVFESSKLRMTKSGGADKREIVLRFRDDLSPRDVTILGQFFRALPQVPNVTLEIDIVAPTEESATVDLQLWSPSLCSLGVHRPAFCRSVLKQLVESTEDLVTGLSGWVCPNLTSVELCYIHEGEEVEGLDGIALESLVHARWSGRAGEELLKFAIRCEEDRFPSIRSRAESLKQYIPRLSLVME
ncbi:hypothetical protein FRC01_007732 [Tulasnella sp. 417]|nr:hypothetical protein FRC01_007732 [Tulasnella sp. 417]